jgi:Kinesin-like protein
MHYHKGLRNKVMASHNLNNNSSRSHCIFCLTVEALDKSGRILRSKFQVVDLAGSEKTSQTGNEGIRLKESIDINRALFTLRQVITNLSNGESFVPYRDSKLTSLLKQSIGGNSYCVMIACLSPVDDYLEENISTLEYATKAGCISNEPVKNVDPKTK